MFRKLYWPFIIVLSALATGIFAMGNMGGPLRPVLSFWFMLVCPGMAIIRLLKFDNHLVEIVLAVALSLAISTITAEFMVLTHLWSPLSGLAALIAISLIGALLQIRNVVRRSPTMEKSI